MDAPYDLLIINGTVVTAADIGSYDIAVKDGKIALLAPNGGVLRSFVQTAKKVIDAEGGMVMVVFLSPFYLVFKFKLFFLISI